MKASLKKIIAREWLILLFSVIIGSPLLILILSIVSYFLNPTSRLKETCLSAWWYRVSQSELEGIKVPEFETKPDVLSEEIKEAIVNFRDNVEKSTKFTELSFYEKYRKRNEYFTDIYRGKHFYFIAEKKLAEQIFQKTNMENDIKYIKNANKWIEPSEGEDLNGSRTRWANMIMNLEPELEMSSRLENAIFSTKLRWNNIWNSLGESLRESFGSVMLFALIPYFLSILVRSIVWAVKNR